MDAILRMLEAQKIANVETVLDVGANRGGFVSRALAAWPEAKIHAFEPDPSSFLQLATRFEGLPAQVQCHEIALGSGREQRTLFRYKDSCYNSLYKSREEPWGFAQVSVESLDAFCEARSVQSIDVLKIDVEGHEVEVFRGAKRILTSVRCVGFETSAASLPSILDLLSAFEVVQCDKYNWLALRMSKGREVG
jgi:FkbM family methyltransferase